MLFNKIHRKLSLNNDLANDSNIAGVIEEASDGFREILRSGNLSPKPLLVCSGGTSSRCAYKNHWTFDLRKKYRRISFDTKTNQIELEAGNNINILIDNLNTYNRSFPAGLSTLPGFGYLLTGGISPLSRTTGLAIDQILKIKGFFGNGEEFEIDAPNDHSNKKDKLLWKGLSGAAPFLGIVTGLTLKTIPSQVIFVWQAVVNPQQLVQLIMKAEKWPNSISLQWVWKDFIKVYLVIYEDNIDTCSYSSQLQKDLEFLTDIKISKSKNMNKLPNFSIQAPNQSSKIYAEVLGLLGPSWEDKSSTIINKISRMMNVRPNPNSYIASQQLGGVIETTNINSTSFVHRNSMWKPWITATWEEGNKNQRMKSLFWLQEVWETLEPYCPGNHLAQLHNHLSLHEREVKAAFKDWLPGLRELKSMYDPYNNLPNL